MNRTLMASLACAALFLLGLPVSGTPATDAPGDFLPAGSILRVQLGSALKPSRLQPGSPVDGTLLRPLYLRSVEAVPSGSQVHLVIDKVERVEPRGSRFGALLANIGRLYWSQRIPEREYTIAFRAASLCRASGDALPIQVSFLQAFEPSEVRADSPRTTASDKATAASAPETAPSGTTLEQRKRRGRSVLLLQLEAPVRLPQIPATQVAATAAGSQAPRSAVLPPGSRAHLLLLNTISASKNRVGDVLQARLEEPIRLSDQVALPEGFLFQGRVAKLVPPRRLNRSGSVRLNFDRMTLPQSGQSTDIAASLTGAELDRGSGVRMDAEGTLRAPARSAKRLALQFGVGALSGKVADDLADTIIKVTVGGSNATLTRYIGLGTALVYFFAHRGDDVIISKYSELEVTFDRAVAIPVPE